MRSVARISVSPVQGFALHHPDEVELAEHGVLENRRFFLADDQGTDMGGRAVRGRSVRGAWEEPLAALAGHPVRIVRSDVPGARQNAPVTLLSDASVTRLAREAGQPVDDRRFRMLFTLAGCDEHEEDGWEGRLLEVGEALLRVGGPVERCAVTTRDPDTGERDLDTLRLLAELRGRNPGDPVHFGVYSHVERPGRVRLGDPVRPR